MNQFSFLLVFQGFGQTADQSLSDRVPLLTGTIVGDRWRIIKPRSGDCKYPRRVFVFVYPLGQDENSATGRGQSPTKKADHRPAVSARSHSLCLNLFRRANR